MSHRRSALVVLACGFTLLVSCLLWAVLVQRIGADVCSLRPVPKRAGPVTCLHPLARHPRR